MGGFFMSLHFVSVGLVSTVHSGSCAGAAAPLYEAALCQNVLHVSCGGTCCLLLLCLEHMNRADALVLLPATGSQSLQVHTHCAAAVCCTVVASQFHSVGALCRCCCAKARCITTYSRHSARAGVGVFECNQAQSSSMDPSCGA